MLLGYVSDERFVALEDVAVEIIGNGASIATHSRASGAIHADLGPGTYEITLSCAGFGGKRVNVSLPLAEPLQFRLLADNLLGYAWPKWARAGEKSEWRVHSVEPYKLGLWRYGAQKEFIRNLGWYDDHGPRATAQLLPDGDFTQSGVQWNQRGYGSAWHQQRIVAPDRSGLYYFHARTAAGEFFSFPWIVMPAVPKSKTCVLTSNITWNAYNIFGGRSNYVNQNSLPPRPVVHTRSELNRFLRPGEWPFEISGAPLSFDRPETFNSVPENDDITSPIEGRLSSAMAPAEWRLLGWMEREGFDYDLYSETELHWDRIPLGQYRVLVLNTHPEYWTKEMYFRVKDWVFNRGGKLMYLGGCGMYAELEFLDEQTMICRREEPHDMRGEPSAKLLGVAYSHAGYQSGAPYRVLDETHWAFAGTGLNRDDLFGHFSLHERCPGGASAHELDKICADSPANLRHLARGDNPEESGADLVTFDTPSGGAVFSTGSLCWTLSIAVDEGVSQVTANVLRKFLQ
ncbi:MAG: N,N-dimethylformamidase beta subunit family domain-containing protein [Pirellulales bacterium]